MQTAVERERAERAGREEREKSETYTHGERLGSLLDHEALDDMREHLRLNDGLGRLVLPVVRRAGRHCGRLVPVARGHGRGSGLRSGRGRGSPRLLVRNPFCCGRERSAL